MEPHERRLRRRDVAHYQHERLLGLVLHAVGHDPKSTPLRGQFGLRDPIDELLAGAAVADQLLDRDDLEPVCGGKGEQPVAIGTIARRIEDLAEHARRRQARQPGKIDRGFGVPRPPEHAPFLGHERKQMAGADKVTGDARRIDDGGNGPRPLRRGDARLRRHVVDRHGEGGAQRRGVGRDHHRQVEPLGHVGQDRQAELTTAFSDHEVDHRRCGRSGCGDEIAFVLPILRVDDDDHLAPRHGGDSGFDGRKTGWHAAGVREAVCVPTPL